MLKLSVRPHPSKWYVPDSASSIVYKSTLELFLLSSVSVADAG